jgi:hypothetical protein
MTGFNTPSNPVELASIRAEASVSQAFGMSSSDERLLAELDFGADQLGFHNQNYFVQTFSAFAVPVAFEAGEPLRYHSFMGLALEGRFATFSKIHIGRIVGAGAVRAVCLTFTDVTLLPYFDTLPESDLLHVPVLAVSEISATSG